jgi:hypothetical protein
MRFELKPLSFGEVLDGSFKIFRDRTGLFVSIAVVFHLPLTWASTVASESISRTAGGARPGLPPGFVLFQLISLGGYLLFWGVSSAAAVQVITGEPTSFRRACGRYLSVLGPTLLGSFVLMVLTLLLCLLLIVPGVIFALNRSLFVVVLLAEGGSGLQALKRSKKLVKGGPGRAARLLGANMLFAAVGLALNWGFGLLIPPSLKATWPGALLRMIPQTVIAPVYAITVALLYFDARVRDEAYDLELRAKDAEAVTVGPA